MMGQVLLVLHLCAVLLSTVYFDAGILSDQFGAFTAKMPRKRKLSFAMPKDLKHRKTKLNRNLVDQSEIPMTPEPVNGSHKDQCSPVAVTKLQTTCKRQLSVTGVINPKGYRIIDCEYLNFLINLHAVCSSCKSGSLSLIEDVDAQAGWCSLLGLKCIHSDMSSLYSGT